MGSLSIQVTVKWNITHFNDKKGNPSILSVTQYVNGTGDKGFSCKLEDYVSCVHAMLGSGQLSTRLDDAIYNYYKKFNIKFKQV